MLFAMALLIPSLVVSGGAPAQGAQGADLDDKRSEAARIQAQIDAQAERIAALDIQLDAAQARAARADAATAQARARLADAYRRVAEVRARLSTQAIEAYVQGSPVSVLEQLSGSDGADLSVRNQYIKSTTANHRDALEDLKASLEDLGIQRDQLESARRAAGDAAEALAERLRALQAGESSQLANLGRVNGELAQLLREEQARRSQQALQHAAAARASLPRGGGARPAPASGGSPGGTWSCIRQKESSNNYRAPGGGAYQFKNGTWEDMGGTGRPEDAPPAEQDERAMKLYQQRGWQPWTTARSCGAYG